MVISSRFIGLVVGLALSLTGALGACADILSADVELAPIVDSGTPHGDAAFDGPLDENTPDGGPAALPGDAGRGPSEGLSSVDASAGGSWCTQNAIGKTRCWDFDVDGGLLNGWDERSSASNGTFESTTGKSAPNALLSKLASTSSYGIGQAWLARHFSNYARALTVDFDIKWTSCDQGSDQTGLSLGGITIGNDQTGTYWYVELLAPTFTGLRYVQWSNYTIVASRWTGARTPLPEGVWVHVQIQVVRSTKTTAQLKLSFDLQDGQGLQDVTDPWTVTTDPSDESDVFIGEEKTGFSSGCEASYDDVIFNMEQ